MRIHIHNTQPHQRLTSTVWEAAVSRAPDVGDGHRLSFGDDEPSLAGALAEAELLVCVGHGFPRPLPAAAPRLRLLFVTFAGVDGLQPLDWLPEGCTLLNNSGTHAAKAGEFVLMALLMLAAQMPALAAAQREQRWDHRLSSTLAGRRVTVVGLGSLGGAGAQRASQFGMRVSGVRAHPAPHPACDTVAGLDGLDALLPTSEALVLACPLTDRTRHLLDRRRIALLPRGAGVVNIGRGGLVEQDALCDALDDGHLGGAVLDVFTPEPVPPGHRLWTTRNLVMTPHVSSDDPAHYLDLSLDVLMRNLRALRDDEPLPNRVQASRGY